MQFLDTSVITSLGVPYFKIGVAKGFISHLFCIRPSREKLIFNREAKLLFRGF
jgi:hypothetical protein